MKRHSLFWMGIPALIIGIALMSSVIPGDSASEVAAAPNHAINYTSLLENAGVAEPSNLVPLTPKEQLGKNLLFDTTLSTPSGFACASCHSPETGFTGPSSEINRDLGVMPGVVPGRFGHRKPQTIAYSTFSPNGPYFDADLEIWLGGNFWDGRAANQTAQAKMPFIDVDEMANAAVGPVPPHSGGYSSHLVAQVKTRSYATLFAQAFGPTVTHAADSQFYDLITQAIAAYESSIEVNPFSSRFDASQYGVPAMHTYRLTAAEERGRVLFFGQAQCFQCHSSATLQPVLAVTGGKDTFTMYCYANIGVPRNLDNPFYTETDSESNPQGYNSQGTDFVDFGLGANPNPAPGGMQFMQHSPGDIAAFRGLFKAPSLRNAAKRPSAAFVKAYMHNGVFKNLHHVVRFYNKRNVAVHRSGRETVFDLRNGPPAGYTPYFNPPEVLDNVQNAAGLSPAMAGGDVDNNGQVGNLGLTRAQEVDLVKFLETLSDGYLHP